MGEARGMDYFYPGQDIARPRGGSATGEVGNITSAAGRAGEYLSTAGEAIGQGSRRGMVYKKGGKVKKKKKNPTIKVRGAGKVIKGVRPAKMVKMKGS
tara:strand:+ start:202 stop:495 length:294 start_codon:yes stop_codon:yes gene_type:complete